MTQVQSEDSAHMQAALRLAERGLGRTAPNPTVGCIIVDREGAVVGEGFHERAGDPHAEVNALRLAGSAAAGGTAYVTLEPCSHWGRTPPCVDAVLSARVRRVVVAMQDPDVRVSGRGIQRLRDHGIEVRVGIGAARARRLNEGYLKVKRTGHPFVLLKMAMTLDGRVATSAGDSKWVSSSASRSHVQLLRDEYDAVFVGIGTVLADDPALTVRPLEMPAGTIRSPRSPIRVVVDSRARTPVDARIIREPGQCIVMTTRQADANRLLDLREAGAKVVVVENNNDRVDLRSAMQSLVKEGIHSVLCEGGPELAAAALDAGILDRMLLFVAPKILGDKNAIGPVAGQGNRTMAGALRTGRLKIRRFPPDIAIECEM